MNVCYSGFWTAYSGMGEAARNIVASLDSAKVNVTTELVPNYTSDKNLGPAYKLCQELHNKPIDYNIKIIHTTPDLVTKYMIPMKYHIFHLFWETDRLPKWWVWALNLMDEIWTGSDWNKEIFLKSGVKKPIWVCPQPVDTTIPEFKPFSLAPTNGQLVNHAKDFIFYSVFQWIERKDPLKLVRAYWETFKPDDDVILLLKTYKDKFTNNELQEITNEIVDLKNEMKLTHVPRIQLFTELMSRGDIYRFHSTGDCFVSAHRGEGFGIPIAEAMLTGNPVISTNLGGVHEHIPKDLAYFTKYKLTNVFNMGFVPWYDTKQIWAEADIDDLKGKMRYVFDHKKEAREVGLKAKDFIKSNLSYINVGNKMKLRLEEIERSL